MLYDVNSENSRSLVLKSKFRLRRLCISRIVELYFGWFDLIMYNSSCPVSVYVGKLCRTN